MVLYKTMLMGLNPESMAMRQKMNYDHLGIREKVDASYTRRLLQAARPFVFHDLAIHLHQLGIPMENEPHVDLMDSPNPLISALPFKTIFIEQSIDFPITSIRTVDMKSMWSIYGMLVSEVAPDKYRFTVLFGIQKTSNTETGADNDIMHSGIWDLDERDDQPPLYKKSCRFVLSAALAALNKEEIADASVREMVKLKVDGKKIIHKIRKIVYVCPKKISAKFNPCNSRLVDWSHRWLVRGHWRKCANFGKDREGVYCVRGFTWVTEHEKGPDEMPLVADKMRYVKNLTPVVL